MQKNGTNNIYTIIIINSRLLPLQGTSNKEHTPFYLYTYPLKHKKTHKQNSKQKAFNLQPFQTYQDLAKHL